MTEKLVWAYTQDSNGGRVIDRRLDATVAACANVAHGYADDPATGTAEVVYADGFQNARLLASAVDICENFLPPKSRAAKEWAAARRGER